MGIFGFFKKSEPIVVENEKLSRNELFEWLLNKKKEHDEKEQEFVTPIKDRISQLISELNGGISILEGVNLDNIKVDHKIRIIVRENLRNYLMSLSKVIERLNEIEGRERIIERINPIFEEFEGKTNISYQKISFLIPKEIRDVKDSIRKFLKDLGLILKSNKKLFEEFGAIEFVEIEVDKLNEAKKHKSRVLEILGEDSGMIEKLEQELNNKKNEIENLKKSDEFIEGIKKKEALDEMKNQLIRNVEMLSRMIDFKILSTFYHKFERDMKLVKQYKDNFKLALRGLGMKELVRLLREAKQGSEEIFELTDKIKNMEEDVSGVIIPESGVVALERDINRIQFEIQNIESGKSGKEKRVKSFDDDLDSVFERIKGKLIEINVELE